MSGWVDGKIVEYPDKAIDEHPGWVWRDCGCCAGTQWGGEEPRECDNCVGQGQYAVHLKSGTMAEYPGGPLLGRLPRSERAS